jgi:hypothetical protein
MRCVWHICAYTVSGTVCKQLTVQVTLEEITLYELVQNMKYEMLCYTHQAYSSCLVNVMCLGSVQL